MPAQQDDVERRVDEATWPELQAFATLLRHRETFQRHVGTVHAVQEAHDRDLLESLYGKLRRRFHARHPTTLTPVDDA